MILMTLIILDNNQVADKDFSNVRGKIGFCPQKDILLNENTVVENLDFIAEIKGLTPE